MTDESLTTKPDARQQIDESSLFAGEYYAGMLQLLLPTKDPGHRDRLREEIERAIAKGSDWV
jgi:hypothetical protein